MVQWHKHRVDINFEFTGGIIITSNLTVLIQDRDGWVRSLVVSLPAIGKLVDPELAALMLISIA